MSKENLKNFHLKNVKHKMILLLLLLNQMQCFAKGAVNGRTVLGGGGLEWGVSTWRYTVS